MPENENHATQVHYSLSREINEMYWSIALANFSIGLIGLFVPIYIYQYFGGSLAAVFWFYIAQSIGQVLLVPFSAKLVHVWGVKKLIGVGRIFLSLYLILLMLLATHPGLTIIILATIAKIASLITSPIGYHIDFAKFASTNKRGRQIGIANVFAVLGKSLAPLIGGFMIISLGYTPVYIVATILLIFSTGPLFFSKELYETYTLSWIESYKTVFKKENVRTSVAFFCEGVNNATGLFLFPIFLYLMIGELETLGWITSFSLVLTFLFSYVIGWLNDKKGSHRIISFTSVAHGFSWLINSFIVSPLQFLIFSSFYRLADMGNQLPMTTLFYQNAKMKGHGIDEYVVFHELAHNFGRIAVFAIFIIGFTLGSTSFLFYFAIAGIAALCYRLMK